MAFSNEWEPSHRSGSHRPSSLLRWTEAEPRPHGAVRYQCPVNDSFVVVTDDATLADLARPHAQVRCPFCGERHLLMPPHGADRYRR